MAVNMGILPGSVETEDTQRLCQNNDKLIPNGTSTPSPVSPTGQTQRRGSSDTKSVSGCFKRQHKMRLNIGGVLFMTHSRTLERFPGTRLAMLTEEDESYDTEEKEFFFDRNSLVFHGVLDYYRTGQLHMPQNICARVIHTELTFWGIQDKELSECCWQKYREYCTTEDCVRTVMNTFCHEAGVPPLNNPTKWQHYKNFMWNVLEYPRSSCLAMMWAIGFSIIMFVSIFITIFEGMPEFRIDSRHSSLTQFLNTTTNPKEQLALSTELHPVLVVLELTSSFLLTIDLLLRLIFCPSKTEFFKSSLNWIEVLSQIMVWYVSSHYISNAMETQLQLTLFNAAMCLRNMRVLRLFRMAKHLPAWRILMLSLRNSTSEIAALLAFVITGVLVFAVLIYSAQFFNDDEFKNVPIGFWWAVVTMTTVGYGDFYPTTIPGYVVGALCAMCGMLATGLPIPLIANNFNLLYSYYKMRKQALCDKCDGQVIHTLDDQSSKSIDTSIKAAQPSNDSAYVEDCMLQDVMDEHSYERTPNEALDM